MAVRTKVKLLFGKDAKYTFFGRKGHASGMYTGGFDFLVYGIKGIVNYTKYTAWGGMISNNPNLI